MLRTRIVTAVVLLLGLLAALFFLPTLAWAGFCALICALAAWEWGGLAGWGRKERVVYGIVSGCLCFVPVFLLWLQGLGSPGISTGGVGPLLSEESILLFLGSLFLFSAIFWLLIVPLWLRCKWALHGWVAAVVGTIVLVPSTLAFIGIREISPLGLLTVCGLVWVADIAAYLSGRTFGGIKLAPSISPGKTWAGAIGAVIGVLVYVNVIVFVVEFGKSRIIEENPLMLQLVIIGLTAWSIIGDLFESLLKRHAGVKDSSNLLPGHGGILDRIDSLTSTMALIGSSVFLGFLF